MWLWISVLGLTLISMVQAQQLKELRRELRLLQVRIDFQGRYLGDANKEAGNE